MHPITMRIWTGMVVALAVPGWVFAQAAGQTQPPAQATAATQAVSAPAQKGDPAAQDPAQKSPPRRPGRESNRQPSASGREASEDTRVSRVGGPTQQALALRVNVMGGYDDNVTGGLGSGVGTLPTAMASGAMANLDGTLDYFVGNRRHSFRLGTTGTLTAYPGYLDQPSPGGSVNLGATTTVGSSTTIGVSQRAGYEPFFNVYSPGASGTPLPPDAGISTPATGLFERVSVNSDTSASIEQRWGRRDSTTLAYAYRLQQFTDDEFGDYGSHNVTATYRRTIGTGVKARAEYTYRNLEYTDSDAVSRPTISHSIVGGPDFTKALSRRRRLTFSFSAGATRLETAGSSLVQPYSTWLPTGSASASLTLSPGWSLDGRYWRDTSLFQGVTDEVYSTDNALVSVGGPISGRVQLRFGGTYSTWRTPVASGLSDTFDVYGVSTQLVVALTETVGARVGYFYYYQRYSNPASLPEGFPAQYNRNAVRVGLTVWVPLAGEARAKGLAPR